MIVSGFRAPSATRLASVISPLVPTMEPTTPDGLLFHRTPNMLNLSVIERRTAHEEMVRHRCRGSRCCCSEGSYGCGGSQRLGSLPVLSSLTGRPALRCGVARVGPPLTGVYLTVTFSNPTTEELLKRAEDLMRQN